MGEQLRDLVVASDGGLFALFTSHRDVREMAMQLRDAGYDARWPLLVHGEEPRDVLLQRFRDSGRAVLLGTATFWEGVDVPGDALRGLLIAKLPFRVPTRADGGRAVRGDRGARRQRVRRVHAARTPRCG